MKTWKLIIKQANQRIPPPPKMHSSMAEPALAHGNQSKAGTPEPVAKFANMLICAVRYAGLTCPPAAVQRPSAAIARHRRPDDAAARLPSSHMEESWMAALNSLACDRDQQPPAWRPPGLTPCSHSRPPSALAPNSRLPWSQDRFCRTLFLGPAPFCKPEESLDFSF